MLTLLVASFVCLYHFGLFDSAVQAQGIWISGKKINATYGETFKSISEDPTNSSDSDEPPFDDTRQRFVITTSISPLTNTTQVRTTPIYTTSRATPTNPEELKTLIDGLNERQNELDQNCKEMIELVRKEGENLQKTYDDLKKQMGDLEVKIPCGINKLVNIENKLNRYVNKTNVAFFVQRNSTYKQQGPIPFSIIQLNSGEGFNDTAGAFIAPVPGIYHFYFSGLKTKAQLAGTSSLTVRLKKVSSSKKEMLAEGHINSQEKYGWFPVQVQTTVFLKKGDQVHVELMEGSLYESGSDLHLLTGFGGFLLGLV